jgi:sulfur carrier protein ThiS adenylyltransferase
MSIFDFDAVTTPYFTDAQRKRIAATRVGVAGAGGLGSNCAHVLVRCGFERLVVADFDVVEPSNLNRQFFFADQVGRSKVEALKENLRRINPALSMTTYQIRLTEESMRQIFAQCDVVVEAFDKAETKAVLVAAFAPAGKLVVCASGVAGFGDSDRIVTRKVTSTVYQVGDGVSEVGPDCKPLAPCVAISAAKMADVVLAWVLGALAPKRA